MPKRDAAYMADQKKMIAEAALAVLIRKGVRETTLRDICKEANISIGALYTHFKTKEEAVVAACQLDFVEKAPPRLPQTWAEYLEWYSYKPVQRAGSPDSKRLRLSLQFVAELTQMERNPKGLSVIYDKFASVFGAALVSLAERSEVALPYGLEQTVEMHLQILAGLRYRIASDRDADLDMVWKATEVALANTAGHVERPAGSSPKGLGGRSGRATVRPGVAGRKLRQPRREA